MDWRDLERWLRKDLIGVHSEIAFRVSLRAFPLLAVELAATWHSRQLQGPILLSLLRVLVTARSTLNKRSEKNLRSLQSAIASLPQISGYDYVARAIRSMGTSVATNQDRNTEHLRRAIQAAKDGALNYRRQYKEGFYDLDTWGEIESDVNVMDRGGVAALPIGVIPNRALISGCWNNLVSKTDFYDQGWSSWGRWLEYRLFANTSFDLQEADWQRIEEEVSQLPSTEWSDVHRLNRRVDAIIQHVVGQKQSADEIPSVEPQNPVALTFEVAEPGVLGISPVREDLAERVDKSAVYPDLMQELERTIEVCSDNSSALVREKLISYKQALTGLTSPGSDVLLVARGEALRVHLNTQLQMDDISDVAPIKEAALTGLQEVVGKHNLLVGLDPGLAELDEILLGPADVRHIISPEEVVQLTEHGAAPWTISPEARSALRELAASAPASPDPSSRASRRTSESAKNLVRAVFRFFYNHRKQLTWGVGTLPPGVYALGKWAIANEQIILGYFKGNSVMLSALSSFYSWLHTLPLL